MSIDPIVVTAGRFLSQQDCDLIRHVANYAEEQYELNQFLLKTMETVGWFLVASSLVFRYF